MNLLILYFFLAVGISFLCSILESVLLSTNMAYIAVLEKTRPQAAALLKSHKKDLNKSIASILILNTIANTLGAAGVGAQAENIFGSSAVFYVSVVLTFAILFFSEIIPKTIGAVFWKELAPIAAYFIRFFIWITLPLIIIRNNFVQHTLYEVIRQIQIEDSGPGISEKILPHIFDPYFSTTEFNSSRGNGLGLAIVHSVINKHKGFISVESKLGEGSCFTFYLPALPDFKAPLDTPGEAISSGPTTGKKVLLMDDEKMIRTLSRNMLELSGFITDTAKDGEEAIHCFKSYNFV